ncbi:hypothetical protein PsorP6_016879 [Peronosclerospora sorghi]|uniref:Uncharacterized protein n=1 Tax=Peronosclerospora sorghi TaxID=230839 RepID=A0ACC0WF76_9STRA|nr:hypothetical protein PsorP6_016879 [Peronosclerospora sorghi]
MDLRFTQATEEQQKSNVVEDGGGNTSACAPITPTDRAADDEGDAGDEAKGSAAAGDVAMVGWSMTLAGTEDRIRPGIDSQEDRTEESKSDDDEREDEEKRRRLDRLHNWPRAKPSKAKSDVWTHFTKYLHGKMNSVAVCEICRSEVEIGDSGSTTNLRAHLRAYHRDKLEELTAKKVAEMDVFVSKAGQFYFRDLLLKWIVMTHHPLSVIHNQNFAAMIGCAKKVGACIPSYNTMEQRLDEIKIVVQSEIVDILDGKAVAITSDCWTSVTQEAYISLTVHFIDHTWKLVGA